MQTESSLKGHTSLQPPAGCGAKTTIVTRPLLRLLRSVRRKSLSVRGGAPLNSLDPGRGGVLGLTTLDRRSKPIYLGRRLFLAR